jgi:hypothetical protein
MEINLGKDFSTGKLIKENVDVGQQMFVLDGDDIQRSLVNTQPQGLVFLLHE